MAKYSIVKIALKAPPGTEYKVYWSQSKHDHNASVATGTWAVGQLAAHLNVATTALDYRAKSFESNQSAAPTGKNIFEVS